MKPRKVNLSLEITTDLPIGVLRKTRGVALYKAGPDGPMESKCFAAIGVQQATATVYQPIPTAKPPKKGAKKT